MNNSKGKVILAGAGPGDPELISVKAARYLGMADVVLTDRLVSPEILSNYVSPNAEIVYVGKEGNTGNSTPQKSINEWILHYALQNKLVVRLKGGDISVFSNILDELQTLLENDIPFELIPGISAALGAAAYAGIPLTARNYALGVRFLTYYKQDIVSEKYWRDLAETEDTLVFYMSSSTLPELVHHLLNHGIQSDRYIAVIEQATTALQNVHVSPICDAPKALLGKKYTSPCLLIVGKVVALHEQFKWLANSNSQESYFKSRELQD